MMFPKEQCCCFEDTCFNGGFQEAFMEWLIVLNVTGTVHVAPKRYTRDSVPLSNHFPFFKFILAL